MGFGWASKFSVGDNSLAQTVESFMLGAGSSLACYIFAASVEFASIFGITDGSSRVSHELGRERGRRAGTHRFLPVCIVCHGIRRECRKTLAAPTVDVHSVPPE